MLSLRNICKKYVTGEINQIALDNVSLDLRDNEFVSILGPSGSGKTTLLNIIGGLDKYDSGDLIINGVSTKQYKDRDWDAYRNHTIGFVFQSYNLIPHQSILSNVELALTISGVSKSKRRQKAKKALERVGLGNQVHKKPNQLSGGQMQRVAIARALVNDPDILLADEPTGALDTETGIQVMDILKEIANDHLVIMVTHNPELADKYSTRIVRLLDGRLTDDTDPMTEEDVKTETERSLQKVKEKGKLKMPSMSLFTSFGLSLKNLITKKSRTFLTSFAGSIGIIGIALIYAVSHGATVFIDSVQEETLSSYPLTIQSQEIDMSTLITTFMGKAESIGDHEKDAVYQKAMFYELMNTLNSLETKKNDLKSFKTFLETERADKESETKLSESVSGVQYTYNVRPVIYTKNVDGKIIKSDSDQLLQEIIKNYMDLDFSSLISMRNNSMMGSSGSMSMMNNRTLWQEMLPGDNGKLINPIIEKQYDLVYGNWPSEYNDVLLVLDENNELDDMTLYALGLKPEEEIKDVLLAVTDHETIEYEHKNWSYEEICAMDFRAVLPGDCYSYDEQTGLYTDLSETDAGLQYLYGNADKLKVSGIIRPKENAIAPMLRGSIAYTSALTEYVIGKANESDVVKAQKADVMNDIFTGLPFKDTDGKINPESKAASFRDHIASLDEKDKAETYKKIMSIPSAELIEQTVEQTLSTMTREYMEQLMSQAMASKMGMSEEAITEYISAMSDEDISELVAKMITEQFKGQYAEKVNAQFSAMSDTELASALDMTLPSYTDGMCAQYYDDVLEFSESTFEGNLTSLGCVDLDSPASINLYASSFEDKDLIEKAISMYNEDKAEIEKLTYTDYVGIIMSSVTTILNAITYVLIAFVAVSLIVSSIMIGVITLISVQERTKEIGILRSIGASKKNISTMFNAETVIIGFTSGLLGVLLTYLLCIPINLILHSLTDINNLSANLPLHVALILIAISIILTLIAGIIPSKSAAKKDPVIALRTE